MHSRIAVLLVLLAYVFANPAFAQDSRGAISGRLLDPSSAPVAGATVVVLNTDTNTATRLVTNQTGYYEANLLLPGNYEITAETPGFKKSVRRGLVLPLSTRLEIDLSLELGTVAETVSVVAQAPLLDTSSVSSGRTVDNRSVMDLPVIGNNTMILVKHTPGIQTSGVNDYLGPHSIAGASDYSTGGNVGGNEWSVDGAPSNGSARRGAYLPFTDTVQEMKVETSGFDASVGHTTGVSVSMMTKSGTNSFHGTLTELHWQQRWRGAPFFTKQLYYRNIAAAQAAGDSALANDLRSQNMQAPGRSNNYAGTIGGPVTLPKIFNGRNKLFFFFSYHGNKDKISDLASRLNNTIPTLDDRRGDFSRLLKVNAGLYQIYDPLSVRADPARPTHYIRDPIPGNILPQSRIVNPARDFYTKVLPIPNNDPNPSLEPRNNFLAVTTPLLRDYKAYTNRVDYHLSDRHRFFGRWEYNDWINDSQDWTYDTMRGLSSSAQTRTNASATGDWVYTLGSSTVIDVSAAFNQFREGNSPTVPLQFKPSDVGLPAYLDAKAGDLHILPMMSVTGYEAIGRNYPTMTRARSVSGRADVSHIRGSHTLRAGLDVRGQFRTGGGAGNTSGNFGFNNSWTRRNDDTFTPAGDLGHGWAAFLMGLPNSMTIATTDSFATSNPYYGWFVQDNWRITPKFSANFGLRMEYELGPTERYNRAIGWFDPNAKLPISGAAQAAYAQNPVPELAASSFVVQGGSVYPGTGTAGRRLWRNELMWLPRFAAAYQLDSKTVLRGGYGLFYDTLNVLNDGPDQSGYSRTTSTILSNDFGVTWLAGNPRAGISPMTDPFPVRADGTRFDSPTRDALGLMARAGRGFTFNAYDAQHARQQRWRIGTQRQIGGNMLLDIAYSGSYADRVAVSQTLSALPEQFWASGLVRNDAVANNLNANVTNPFRTTNLTTLQNSNPLVWQDINTQSFFTSGTIRKNLLLRPYPEMNGVTQSNAPLGKVRTDALEVNFQRRFSRGFNMNVGYTRLRGRAADFFQDEFAATPSWRDSADTRPHRLVGTAIWELPFGKGRAAARSGILNYACGGFQIGVTYEYQPGGLLSWGNLFYYGNIADIKTGDRTLDRWFNTDQFERNAAKAPAAFHRRVFPTQLPGLRADMTNQWNGNVQREFKIRERAAFQLRVDGLNLQNRSQFAGPNTNPVNTNFGRVTSQTNTTNRFIQVQGRFRF